MNLSKFSAYAPAVLRISFSLVILWFGFTSIFNYQSLAGYIPSFAYSLGSIRAIMLLNGVFEIVFGGFLLLGIFARVSAFLLFLHVVIIILGLGYNDVAVRDFGLAFMALAIFLNGEDKWCLSKNIRKR